MQNIPAYFRNEQLIHLQIFLQLDINCSKKCLKSYLEEIYKDLVFRWQDGSSNLLEPETFEKYMNYPKIICEYLFHAIDKQGIHKISQNQFVSFLSTLYSGKMEDRLKMVFDVMDYDHDEVLKNEDVSFLLNYLHSYYNSNENDQSFPLLNLIISTNLTENPQLSKEDFLSFQDLLMLFLLYICRYKPFENENVNYFSGFRNPLRRKKNIIKNKKNKFQIDPSKHLYTYLQQTFFADLDGNELECLDNFETEKAKVMEEILKEDEQTHLNSCYTSPSKLFSISKFPVNNKLVFHEYASNSTSESEKQVAKLKKGCMIHNDTLIDCVFYLVNEELFCLVNEGSSEEVKFIFNLKASFPEKSESIMINNIKYFTLQLICSPYFRREVKYLLFESEDDKEELFLEISQLKSFRNIQDFYEIAEEIGKGHFGVVNLGRSKQGKKHVAIKKISKKQIEETHAHKIIYREIDIFKLLQNYSHPSIVQARDYFENSTHIFLVFEYIKGRNLQEYLSNKSQYVSANELKVIFSQIASGLEFLHSHGIIHGDIKPENIMISQVNKKLRIKLIDFGLSQVISPSISANDSQGSLCYCAPEILLKHSYNGQIDIWSYGILLYFVVYGNLPFYDNENQLDRLCSKIIKGRIPESIAPNRSVLAGEDECIINLLIKSCLQTQPNKRITINAIVNHKWLCN